MHLEEISETFWQVVSQRLRHFGLVASEADFLCYVSSELAVGVAKDFTAGNILKSYQGFTSPLLPWLPIQRMSISFF